MFNRVLAKQNAKALLKQCRLRDALIFGGLQIALNLVRIFCAALPIYLILGSLWPLSWSFSLARLTASLLVAPIVASITSTILSLMMHGGLIHASLKMVRKNRYYPATEIISGFYRVGKFIVITLLQTLFLFLWQLIGDALAVIGYLIIVTNPFSMVALTVGSIFIVAGVVFNVVITTIKRLQYYFSYHVAEHQRELSALACLKKSGELMQGNKGKLFVTHLSFIGWWLLMIIPLVDIYVVPYMYLTYSGLYAQLAGLTEQAQATGGRVTVLVGDFRGASFPVGKDRELLIGRDPRRANVVVSQTSISGLHCGIRYDPNGQRYLITDYSRNGTFVGAAAVPSGGTSFASKGTEVKLADGAMVLQLN